MSIILEKCATPSEIMRNMQVLDVSGNPLLLKSARRVVGEHYGRLTNLPRTPEEVCEDLYVDDYDRLNRTKTIVALLSRVGMPFDQSEILGTVRLVTGKAGQEEGSLQPIEAMSLMDVSVWPHTTHANNGFGVSIGELGRFSISEKYRTGDMRRSGLTAYITAGLFEEAGKIARVSEVKYLYSIMPNYVLKLTREARIESLEIGGRLRWENDTAASLFQKYPVYWQRSCPKLYQYSDF